MPDEELLAHAAAGDLHNAGRARRAGAADAAATTASAAWPPSSPATGSTSAASRSTTPSIASGSRRSRTSCARRCSRSRSASSWTSSSGIGSVLDFLYGNHTFVNPVLARHYGMPEPSRADTWVRVDDAAAVRARRPAADGGLPDQERARAAHQPGQARLLGRPPAARRAHPRAAAERAGAADRRGEARRPDAARNARPAPRQPGCAGCHAKFDSFGLVFEGYGPIGETRERGIWGDARSKPAPRFPTASAGAGLDGLRAFMRARGQEEFVDNLCRKLLVYALGRSLLPSDEPPARRDAQGAGGRRLPVRQPGARHRHQPAVPDQTRDASSVKEPAQCT